MSIDNIGDMKECGHAEYRRIYDKYKEKLTVFSSYSGGILGMPQMSTAWGIKGMETALIASECENWEHRREDPEAWTYWKNADLVAALDRAESAESSLAAMRQRAEEAEAALLLHAKADGRGILQWQKATGQELVWPDQGNLVEWALTERDATLARAERAEACLCRVQQLADDGVDDPAGPHNVLAQIANTVEAALSSPPADASTKSEEKKTCADCSHESAKDYSWHCIGCDEKNRERERRLAELLAHMTDAYELTYGKDCPLAQQCREVLAEMEQKS